METAGPHRTTRTFIALDPPQHIRAEIARWGKIELADEVLRAVAADSLHMTLAFLGDLGPEELRAAASVVCETEPRHTSVRLDPAPVGLPKRGRAKRVFVLGCDSPAGVAIQDDIECRLVAAGIFEPDREFWPHLTVARVRSARRKGGAQISAGRLPGPLPEALLEPFDAVRITLYRSKTKSAGPEYTPLAQVELPQGIHAGQR